jgi:dolichyl-phosphate-mannose--protein O-mannosyl transferase
MFQEISYTLIFGKPLILYLGVATILLFFLTAAIAILDRRGIHTIPFRWHPRCAVIAICVALIHGMLGILAYF